MQQTIVNNILINLILTYQKYLSPHKGYCCAHSVLHGNSSCSSWAVRILKKQRASLLLPLMKRRFQACNKAHEKLKKEESETKKNSDTVDPCPCSDKPIADCCLGCGLGLPFSWF